MGCVSSWQQVLEEGVLAVASFPAEKGKGWVWWPAREQPLRASRFSEEEWFGGTADGVGMVPGFGFVNVSEAWKGALNAPSSLRLSLPPLVTR